MPVPTVAWWQKKTSATLSDRKNPLITDIDILLTEYHSAQKTDVQKQKILVLILYYCMTWLDPQGRQIKLLAQQVRPAVEDGGRNRASNTQHDSSSQPAGHL